MMVHVILAFTVALLSQVSLGQGNDEHRLLHHLLENYRNIGPEGVVRPVLNQNNNMTVNFGVALVYTEDFNDEKLIPDATFHLWERHSWKDEFLKWNPADYGGIDRIRIPMIAPVWVPDLILFNGIGHNFEYDKDDLGLVSSDGSVLYIPRASRKVRCDLHNPQEAAMKPERPRYGCALKYGSWTYDGIKLNLEFYDGLEDIDITEYYSYDFDLVKHHAVKNVKYYPCCAEPYADLTFWLEFEKAGPVIPVPKVALDD